MNLHDTQYLQTRPDILHNETTNAFRLKRLKQRYGILDVRKQKNPILGCSHNPIWCFK